MARKRVFSDEDKHGKRARSRKVISIKHRDGSELAKILISSEGTPVDAVLAVLEKQGSIGLLTTDNGIPLAGNIRVFSTDKLLFVSSALGYSIIEEGCAVVSFTGLAQDPSVFPFRGRRHLMTEVAKDVLRFSAAFEFRTRLHRTGMLVLAYEGLSGVGKTRALLETMDQVGSLVKDQKGYILPQLYEQKRVQAVYLTFNGTNLGNWPAHEVNSMFDDLMKMDVVNAGRMFMKASLLSQVIYARPFSSLPTQVGRKIVSETVAFSMKRVATHMRHGLGIPDGELVALYVLLDETQLLAKRIGEAGSKFTSGMFGMLGEYMTGDLPKELKLVLIPVLAGTVLPVGTRTGLTDWPRRTHVLEPLDLDSACEILSEALHDATISPAFAPVRSLIEDCMGLPMLLWHVWYAWANAGPALDNTDLFHHLRTHVAVQLEQSVDTILAASHWDAVKRMLRLCLTGKSVTTTSDLETEECAAGYVFAKKEKSGYVYKAPPIVLNVLAHKLGDIHKPLVELKHDFAKDDVLETAFLEMVSVRMLLHENSTCSLRDVIPGVVGPGEVKLKIGSPIVLERELHQFLNTKDKRFHAEGDRVVHTQRGIPYMLPAKGQAGTFNVVFRTTQNCPYVDGRVFLSDVEDDGGVIEIQMQIKGLQEPWNIKEVQKLIRGLQDYRVHGRRRVLVIASKSGFSFQYEQILADCQILGEMLVFFLDAAGFEEHMPGYLGRSASAPLESL